MPSSVIERYEYHAEQKVLLITFRSGAIYAYLDVPEEVYASFRSAQSRGTFLNSIVKRDYNFELIKEADEEESK